MKLFSAVEIEINSNCNKACSYCPNSVAERIEKGHISVEMFENIIQQLSELKYQGKISYHFYNEPTLSPNLLRFIALTRSQLPNSNIELYSNGTKIDLAFFESLEIAGVDKFIITKHEKSQAYLFDETYLKLNGAQLKKVLFQKHHEINLTNRGGILKNITSQINTTLLPCHIPSMMLTITKQGNVLPCFEDFNQENVMGNILDQSLKEIWYSEKYITFRKMLSNGLRHNFNTCKGCSRTEVIAE